MSLKMRFFFSLITLMLSLLFGAIGGFFGPLLHGMIWVLLILLVTPFLLPWEDFVWSQEDLLKDLKELDLAIDSLQEKRVHFQSMIDDVNAKGVLKQDELDDVVKRFVRIRSPDPLHERTLRELLFGAHRRILALKFVVMGMAALGGGLLTYHFYRFFH